jgi:hypothetical protein
MIYGIIIAVAVVTCCALATQVLLVRQVGILHARLGEQARQAPPTRVTLKEISYFDGTVRGVRDNELNMFVLVSASCHLCKPIVNGYKEHLLNSPVGFGVIGFIDADLIAFCDANGVPRSQAFNAAKLRDQLNLWEIPGFIALDDEGNVLDRTYLEGTDVLLKRIERLSS